ncbi:hypothetical protein NPIL_75171 [Nephila pilipes]|uniref:Uncharacterized protein n=1 Tax=Nephila pilipes TaxID=299642 RepID=A0A8X6TXQ7_NEPPI|nr:hypothetical protein NPIL_75171 [Nephila pilipes]
MVNVVRNKAIIRMEFALEFWIQDLRKKNISLNTKMMRTKELNLHFNFSGDNEKESQPGPSAASDAKEFQAIKGCFDGPSSGC